MRRLFGCGCVKPTFNLPNFFDKVPFQWNAANVGVSRTGGIPNITGTFGLVGNTNGIVPTGTGPFTAGTISGGAYGGGGGRQTEQTTFTFNANKSSASYGRYVDSRPNGVIPDHVCILFCIKY